MKVIYLLAAVAAVTAFFVASAQTESASGVPDRSAAPRHESPFACDRLALSPEARRRHFEELGPALRTKVKSVRELTNGFEFEFSFDPGTFQVVTEWAGGEHLCCPFFDIDVRLEREGGALWLRLTGREGVKQFMRADFARWFQR